MVLYEGDSFGSGVHHKRGQLARNVLALTERNGYQIIQTNGQRVYAPPHTMNIQPPPKGCEVFIGKLHKNLYEDELIPLFESVGPLYKFRLMLDFTEQTRGYAFATYFTKQDAEKAVTKLNKYEIRPKLYIGVYKSIDNCRLFVGNLPTDKTQSEVKELLKQYVDGVVDIIMYKDFNSPKLNRGFVFVEFQDHRLAAMARRQFTPENLIAWGRPLYVDWADPLPEVDSRVMSKVSILYLKNLPLDYDSDEIHTAVCNIVGSRLVKKVHKTCNYAFVHLVNRKHAEIAFQKLQDLVIGNYRIEVEWARPRRYSKKFRLGTAPDNFCTSVPPNMRRLVQQRLSELSFGSRGNTIVDKSQNYNSDSFDLDQSYGNFAHDMPGASSPYSDRTVVSSEYSYFSGPQLFDNLHESN